MKAIIICGDGLEECEALIVFDLLKRAQIEVKLVGLKKEITSSHQLTFKCDETIDQINYQDYDCLILPGGMPGTTNLENNDQVQTMIDYFYQNDKYLAAICAAPSILIKKGLLKDNEFTCFPGHENNKISTHQKVAIKDKIITSRGLGTAFEFATAIISQLKNEDCAKEVLNRIQY